MRHEGKKCSAFFFYSTCGKKETKWQRHVTLPFLKVNMRRWGPPIKGPTPSGGSRTHCGRRTFKRTAKVLCRLYTWGGTAAMVSRSGRKIIFSICFYILPRIKITHPIPGCEPVLYYGPNRRNSVSNQKVLILCEYFFWYLSKPISLSENFFSV